MFSNLTAKRIQVPAIYTDALEQQKANLALAVIVSATSLLAVLAAEKVLEPNAPVSTNLTKK